MKRILKTISCTLVSAFTLIGACACNNSVSDMRSRERQLRERQRQQQQERLLNEEQTLEEVDPDFSVDPGCPDCPGIPENPDDGDRKEGDGEEEPEEPVPPEHGKFHPRRGKNFKPKPVPYPLPHD